MLLGEAGDDPLLPTQGGILVHISWAGDGTYQAYADNVTAQVRPNASPLSVEYGRDQTTALSPTVAGRGGLVLDNRSRNYSPRNPESPLFGSLKPARPVRITRTIGSLVYGLFAGHTDDSPINPDRGSQSVALTLVDYLADFRAQNINTPLHRDLRSGDAIAAVLDAAGWPAELRDLDPGATIIPWWWEDGTDALTALEKIVRSEGPPALLTMGGDGEVIFRDRHHRLRSTNSLVSQGVWRAGGPVEPIIHKEGFTYDEAWRNIINSGTVSVDVRGAGEFGSVWTSESTLALLPGEQRIISIAATEPFFSAITPQPGTDYTVMSGAVTMRLIRTSGLSTGIEVTAGPVGAVVTAMQLRAYPLVVTHTVQVSAADSESVDEFGARSFPADLPWCSVGDAQAVLDVAVRLRSQPLPQVTARFLVGTNPAKAAALLTRDLSDRVTVTEPETYLDNTDFYIESIRHDLTSEYDHAVTFGLEAAPVLDSTVLRFDVSGHGFDLGSFGGGLDNPDTMFRFDAPGHGFNAGRFAT